jgi:hypothetical protein
LFKLLTFGDDPIAYLSPDMDRFILSSNYCTIDESKLLHKLMVGEHYIEKWQREIGGSKQKQLTIKLLGEAH